MNNSTSQPVTPVEITPDICVGDQQPLLLIAGPCQIESLDHCLMIAEFLAATCSSLPVNLVFKSSFDKANRTSLTGARGPGLLKGIDILKEVKARTGLPVLTDIHSAEQAQIAAEVADILQTPAFLCRQTDLLLAAGKTNRVINVKKGQFLHPEDMQFVAEKIAASGNNKILLCERGTCFGYRDLIVDMRGISLMRNTGYPVIFDATHSVQSMGGAGGASGGSREQVAPLARAAVAVGVDGLFIECHEDPDKAPSDGASMLKLETVPDLLKELCAVRAAIGR